MTDPKPLTPEELIEFERRCNIGVDGPCVGPMVFRLIATVRAREAQQRQYVEDICVVFKRAEEAGAELAKARAEVERLRAALQSVESAHHGGPQWAIARAALQPEELENPPEPKILDVCGTCTDDGDNCPLGLTSCKWI